MVVEVGIGSGLNVPFYGSQVERLYGVDPSRELWQLAHSRAARAPFPIEFLHAERIPLASSAVDTVVTTWTLCSIGDPAAAVSEMRRGLKPDGRLVFVERGRAPDPSVQGWQDRLTPVWKRLAGGCHLDRPIDDLLVAGGGRFTELETAYAGGPRPFTYLYRGVADR